MPWCAFVRFVGGLGAVFAALYFALFYCVNFSHFSSSENHRGQREDTLDLERQRWLESWSSGFFFRVRFMFLCVFLVLFCSEFFPGL